MSSLRAIPALLRIGLVSTVAYRSEFLVWALTTNMPLVMLALWSEVAREGSGGVIGQFGEKEFVAYFLATLVVRILTSSPLGRLGDEHGHPAGRSSRRVLLRPGSIPSFTTPLTDNVGALPLRALLSLPVVALGIAWVGRGHVATDLPHVAIALVGIFGAWALVFSAMLLFGSLGLFWESSVALYDFWIGLFFIFSGYLMPLSFFPGWLRVVSWWLPFRYTLAFPVEETLLGLESLRGGRSFSRRAVGVYRGVPWARARSLAARPPSCYAVFGG